MVELATSLGVTESTLRHRLNRLGAGFGQRSRVDALLDDRTWLHQRYVIDQRSTRRIADELDVAVITDVSASR